jgi:hypothetical protein
MRRRSGVYYRSVGKSKWKFRLEVCCRLVAVGSTSSIATGFANDPRIFISFSGAANDRPGAPPNSPHDYGKARLYQHRTE